MTLQLPFSTTVRVGEVVAVSGQLGLRNGELVDGGIKAQTSQAIENLKAALAGEGLGLENVVKVNVYLIDMRDFAAMNEVYGPAFGEKLPARTAVAVAGLPQGGVVELEAWAHADR
ncbi:Rid family hydrolase [Kribbella sp.]|uniref:Rid family hydrolase n=1 Tax=Kribbella sp. TaxID=1871183 RepID=UPI002D79EA22|nr:Rid family hydrolase [Kribbella sp.]